MFTYLLCLASVSHLKEQKRYRFEFIFFALDKYLEAECLDHMGEEAWRFLKGWRVYAQLWKNKINTAGFCVTYGHLADLGFLCQTVEAHL